MSRDLADIEAEPPRPTDEQLTAAELEQLDLFSSLSTATGLDRYASSIELRWFEAGEPVCSHERSAAVFYLLSWEDVLRLKIEQLETAEIAYERVLTSDDADSESQTTAEIQQWIEQLSTIVAKFERHAWHRSADNGGSDEAQMIARLELRRAAPQPAHSEGMLRKFSRRLFGGGGEEASSADAKAGRPPIEFFEGDVYDAAEFQSAEVAATLTAAVDCYALEIPRALYLQIAGDAGLRASADEAYRRRVLPKLLASLPTFQQLNEDQLDFVAGDAELISADPGAIICDEHQAAAAFYLIRSGAVDEVTGQSPLLSLADITDWPGLCQALQAGDESGGD